MATTDRQGEVTNRQRVHADLQILNASDSEGYSSFEDDGSDEDDVILMTFDPGHDNTGAGARPLASESNLLVQEASREVQTSSGACYSPGEAPVLSSAWQESQFVTCSGGTLQLDQSDVVLVIPQNAVAASLPPELQIFAAISTDLENAQRVLGLPEDMCIVSPIAEYSSAPSAQFQFPVQVFLPHSRGPGDAETLQVFQFCRGENGGPDVRPVPMASATNQEAAERATTPSSRTEGEFTVTQDGRVVVSVFHFTGFLVCAKCRTGPPELCLKLYGSHTEVDKEVSNVRLRLYVWDTKLTIRDFCKTLESDHPNDQQFQPIDRHRVLPAVISSSVSAEASSPLDAIGLGACVQLLPGSCDRWRHILLNGKPIFPVTKVIKIGEMNCQRCTDMPREMLIEWALESNPDAPLADNFQCVIEAGYVTTGSDVTQPMESREPCQLAFLRSPEKTTFFVQRLRMIREGAAPSLATSSAFVDNRSPLNNGSPRYVGHQPVHPKQEVKPPPDYDADTEAGDDHTHATPALGKGTIKGAQVAIQGRVEHLHLHLPHQDTSPTTTSPPAADTHSLRPPVPEASAGVHDAVVADEGCQAAIQVADATDEGPHAGREDGDGSDSEQTSVKASVE